ncbi:riboflavin synthase [Methylococcus geothermalis]|uniref:Riboflavin synthase n=1 Tax=Methylococcus geothermalis TaxID=2681310 RepID=A0A858Q7Q6_9GAMM|nr:riboflavin synthase [Methylococcus geothermalis]QJD29814.1 riboflavin synthase [Methylococcus geothermalis]
MFTGIIQAKGQLQRKELQGGDCRLTVAAGKLAMAEVRRGDSIAVNGICLTVIEYGSGHFSADVSRETLSRTTLGELEAGAALNLELALTPAARLGGHIVSGHVDGVGVVGSRVQDGRSVRFRIDAPANLAKYIAEKGSICIDGVSLTVNRVDGCAFDVNVVPHTLAETTLGETCAGRRVNLEVDLLARYLERLMLGDAAARPAGSLTRESLRGHGFIAE